MNRTDITFATIRAAARHYWKKCTVIVLICAILGAGFGAWYAPRSVVAAKGTAQSLTPVTFSDVLQDEYYYARCAKKLDNEYAIMEDYLETLKNEIGQSGNSHEILVLYEQLEEIKTTDFTPIKDNLASSTMYVLLDCAPKALAKCQKILAELNYSNFSFCSITMIPFRTRLNAYVDQLENHTDELSVNAQAMDDLLAKAVEDVDSVQLEINRVAEQVALQNNVNISIDINMSAYTDFSQFSQLQFTDPEDPANKSAATSSVASVVTMHTSRTTSANEAFWAIVITMALFGACGSVFWAICKETAGGRKKDASS